MNTTPLIEGLRARLAEQDLSPATVARTLTDAAQYETWHRGTYNADLDPNRITPPDLSDYRAWLQRRGMKPTTIHRKFASIRTMLRVLAPERLAQLRFPKLPPILHNAPSGFTRVERNAIIRGADALSARDRCIVILALNTGARASSLSTVTLAGIRINARSGTIEFHGKGSKTYSVPLNVEAREAINRWLQERPKVAHDSLFCAERHPHAPISRWIIHHVIHRRLTGHLPRELADGLRGSHQFRHDLARRLISGDEGRKSPVPLADVAAILSHSDVRITASTYCRPSDADLQRALDRMVDDGGD